MTAGRRRRATAWIVSLTGWLLSGPALNACPVCFQLEEGPAAAGVRGAVVVLLGVTVSVLASASVFVVRFARRTARLSEEAGK